MREVGSNLLSAEIRQSPAPLATYTLGVDDIVEGELGDKGVKLEEQREGLTDTACC